MNVETATVKVDYFQATRAYTAYRQAIKENRATKDDVQLARAYHALLRGKKVIDVGVALTTGGLDARNLPKLAVSRADWPLVWVSRSASTDWRYQFSSREYQWGRKPKGEVAVRLPIPPQDTRAARAQVPLIPPQFRPKGSLSEYHILFEPNWEPQPPDPDPLLLKRLDNDGLLFVVLAAWDLTPLEQAVLRARL